MLIEFLFARIFSFHPVIFKSGNLLVARSGLKEQIFCLGFGGRKLVVDPLNRVLRLYRRFFWCVLKTKFVEFDWVEEVLYGYSDMGWGLWTHRELDLFTVSLRLKNGEEVALFRFFGEGGFVNDSIWPDWMYWSENLMTPLVQGNQASESQMLVDLLAQMLAVPVGSGS